MRCPPSAGAIAGPKEWLKLYSPMARPRLSGGKVLYKILMLSGDDGTTPDALEDAEDDERIARPRPAQRGPNR